MPLPLLQHKRYEAPSAFTPESLLREARRQKGLEPAAVPALCVLDPDGDLVRRMREDGRAQMDGSWACYHTDLYRACIDGLELGLLACAVGACRHLVPVLSIPAVEEHARSTGRRR